jgi:hypothetical protein
MSWLENACMSGALLLFSILKNIAPLPPSVNDTPQHLDDCLIRVYDFATHSGTLRATIMLTNHKVYLKSRKFSLFLQPQLDFALNPACVCGTIVIFFAFSYTLRRSFAP